MASGNNKGKLSKQAITISRGHFSGRGLGYKNGPGAPPKKTMRKTWWAGPPMKVVKENATISSVTGERIPGYSTLAA